MGKITPFGYADRTTPKKPVELEAQPFSNDVFMRLIKSSGKRPDGRRPVDAILHLLPQASTFPSAIPPQQFR